jgi:hypothetical protein
MPEQSHSGAKARLKAVIRCEGVVIGQGQVRSIDAPRAFVEIRDFPLGANRFLELYPYGQLPCLLAPVTVVGLGNVSARVPRLRSG